MSFAHEYNLPYFVGTGSVLTTGTPNQLTKGQLAVIDAKTGAIQSGVQPVNRDLQVAVGSWHTVDMLGRFTGGLTQSDKSPEFRVKDIISFDRSYPLAAQSEMWSIGWDGVNNCNGLQFYAATTYRFKIKVWGEDVYGTYTRPVEREIDVTTGCPSITGDCQTGNCFDAVDTLTTAYALQSAIQNDPELTWFVQANVISSNYAATTPTHYLWTLTVADLGDVQALASVQNTYPTLQISLLSRTGIYSTYQACSLITAGTPAAYTAAGPIAVQVCTTCPSGYTPVAAVDVWVVTKAVSASDSIDTPAHQATYAAAVVTAYSGISASGVFLSSNGAVAQVQLNVTAGTVLTATSGTSDQVQKISTTEATCTPPAGSSVAWVNAGNRYKVQQPLYFTLQKTCGGANQLAAVQAFYAADPNVVSGSVVVSASGVCSDKYTLSQWSQNCAVDTCLSKPIPTYSDLQWFQGQQPLADPCAVITPTTNINVGVILTAAYVGNTQFKNPSFYPTDYYSVRPLKLEVTQVIGIGTTNYDGDGKPCNNFIATKKLQASGMPTQSGEQVIREFLRQNRYRVHGEYYHDTRLREVMDNTAFYAVPDRTQNYVTYHLKVQQDRSKNNFQGDFSPEIYEFVFAFPVSVNATAFETYIESFTAQNGVFLRTR